jgi:hypothetical protein
MMHLTVAKIVSITQTQSMMLPFDCGSMHLSALAVTAARRAAFGASRGISGASG